MMAREKDQGSRAERKRLLDSLGLTEDADVSDVKAKLDKQKANEDAALSATEKAKRDAEADRATAKREAEQAVADRLAAKRERLLTRAGVNPDVLDDADALLARTLESDASDEAITAAVDKLKERHAGMFQAAKQTPARAPSGGPQGTPPRQQPQGDAYERGQARAKALAGTSGE